MSHGSVAEPKWDDKKKRKNRRSRAVPDIGDNENNDLCAKGCKKAQEGRKESRAAKSSVVRC